MVRMLPNRVARGNDRHFDPIPIFDPKRFARPAFVGVVLEKEDAQQPIGLAGDHFARLTGIRRIQMREVETDQARVCVFHEGPGPLGLPGEQVPSILPVEAETIGVIVPPAPFNE